MDHSPSRQPLGSQPGRQPLGSVGGIDARTVLILASVALVLGAFGAGLGVYATVQVRSKP
jgi:uncharacterized protein HemX